MHVPKRSRGPLHLTPQRVCRFKRLVDLAEGGGGRHVGRRLLRGRRARNARREGSREGHDRAARARERGRHCLKDVWRPVAPRRGGTRTAVSYVPEEEACGGVRKGLGGERPPRGADMEEAEAGSPLGPGDRSTGGGCRERSWTVASSSSEQRRRSRVPAMSSERCIPRSLILMAASFCSTIVLRRTAGHRCLAWTPHPRLRKSVCREGGSGWTRW